MSWATEINWDTQKVRRTNAVINYYFICEGNICLQKLTVPFHVWRKYLLMESDYHFICEGNICLRKLIVPFHMRRKYLLREINCTISYVKEILASIRNLYHFTCEEKISIREIDCSISYVKKKSPYRNWLFHFICEGNNQVYAVTTKNKTCFSSSSEDGSSNSEMHSSLFLQQFSWRWEL